MYSENLSVSEVKANMFEKRTVVELTENEMTEIDGGTSPIFYVQSSGACLHVAGAVRDLYQGVKEALR